MCSEKKDKIYSHKISYFGPVQLEENPFVGIDYT